MLEVYDSDLGEDVQIDDDTIMDYLVEEYDRGAFSDFDFNLFFEKIGKSS